MREFSCGPRLCTTAALAVPAACHVPRSCRDLTHVTKSRSFLVSEWNRLANRILVKVHVDEFITKMSQLATVDSLHRHRWRTSMYCTKRSEMYPHSFPLKPMYPAAESM